MPDPFMLPFRGLPLVDARVWHRLYGFLSPRARGGTHRMIYARIIDDREARR